jgi:aminoglycoside 6-adenylyltransferase
MEMVAYNILHLMQTRVIYMNSYDEIMQKLVSLAKGLELIQAMILFGSRVRSKNTADKYSDYDIIFLVKDVDYFLNTDQWLTQIEEYYISFQEPTAACGQERRVFFRDAMDMDFLFYDVKGAERLVADHTIQAFFSHGYRILVDKIDFNSVIERNKPFEEIKTNFSEKEFINLANTFWFHSIWSVKKILRGEIWSAKKCVDGYMKDLLRQMLEEYSKAVYSNDFEVWHDGRFIDDWIDQSIKKQLKASYGIYDATDILRALNNTMQLFSEVSVKTAVILDYAYPITAETYAVEQVKKLTLQPL